MAKKKSLFSKVNRTDFARSEDKAGAVLVQSPQTARVVAMRQLIAKKVAAEKLLTARRQS